MTISRPGYIRWASLMTTLHSIGHISLWAIQWQSICLPVQEAQRHGFSAWVWKILWRRKWQPTPVIYLENPTDTGAWQVIVPEVTKSQTQLSSHTNKTSLSVQFSRSVVSDSLRPHEPQHTKTPCPSPTPIYSNSCPLSQCCHLPISLSVTPFSSCP